MESRAAAAEVCGCHGNRSRSQCCCRRFVDGIEAETSSTSSQKFDFSPSLSPAAPASLFTAPPSLTSSPGDQQLRPSPSVVPLVSPSVSLHPSSVSLDCVSARRTRRQADTRTPAWCKSRAVAHPQELEMQEWGGSSAEPIGFIDDDEPAL
ncbi:putative potassium voltage-gated channel subfamily H member 8-like [Scophthalmus maximus]|uniref:Putative potassium voltage-gated channel subfamily H member 8-like n=1 Tax=Scophthalmus maximus TaxID=52904 RepID=A0A2U9CAS7_SCOMX|nr:putative potassium voltage-gated channel subfamily H member 8-like [Scophthalmus maximus]